MNLIEQCQQWNEQDEFQKIIDAIEAIPADQRTPELDSELARAYNNLAEPTDRHLFQKSLALLKPHENYFKGDHCWNFRIAYAYYYLEMNQPHPAFEHLQKGAKYLTPHTYFMYRVLYYDAYALYYRRCKEYDKALSQLDSTIVLLQ